MTEPNIASFAALMGDPARARMLLALMAGRALTATELAVAADVTPQTASAHLGKLTRKRLLRVERQGRHRYFQLAGPDVARLIETLSCVATDARRELRTGPRDPALRAARVCYDHLAGTLGVQVYEALVARGRLRIVDAEPVLTDDGERFAAGLGIDVAALRRARRPLCRRCLDWSERRHHLAGALGAALLDAILAHRWARRTPGSRALRLAPDGHEALARALGLQLPDSSRSA